MQLVALHNDPNGGEYQSGRNATHLYQQSPYGIIETMTTNSNGSGKTRLEDQVAYDPNHLLDSLIEKLGLKNDAALSRALEVAPPVISKIRHRRLPVGASLLIRMHEVSDLSIRDLRVLMGDRREKFRISDKQFKPKEDVASASGSAAQH
jgi:hypothetical protein